MKQKIKKRKARLTVSQRAQANQHVVTHWALAEKLVNYIIKGNRPAHIWTGSDTLCRMASTGGLSLKSYRPLEELDGQQVCQLCESKQQHLLIQEEIESDAAQIDVYG